MMFAEVRITPQSSIILRQLGALSDVRPRIHNRHAAPIASGAATSTKNKKYKASSVSSVMIGFSRPFLAV
jgi:hypothetical protein